MVTGLWDSWADDAFIREYEGTMRGWSLSASASGAAPPTVLRGVEGFGASSQIHTTRLLSLMHTTRISLRDSVRAVARIEHIGPFANNGNSRFSNTNRAAPLEDFITMFNLDAFNPNNTKRCSD